MIGLYEVGAHLVDRILEDMRPQPSLEPHKHRGMRLRLEAMLAKTAEQQLAARWEVRTDLSRALKFLSRDVASLQTTLKNCADQFADEQIAEPLRLAAMDAFAKRKRPYCTSEYLRTVGFSAPPRIVEQIDAGFKDLKDILHHARPSQGDDLQPLFRGVRDMQAVIEGWNEYFDDERITEPFRLAAIDAYAERKRRSRPSAAIPDSDFSSLFQSIKRSEDNLSAFKNMLDHFRRLIEEFDGLDRHSLEAQEEADWIKRGSGSLGQSVRLYLAPYLRNRKDGGLGPDTKLVRLIAELYEYVYGKPFRINGSESKPSYHRAAKKLEWQGANTPAGSLRSGGLVQYKYGDAMKFACSVITHLHLHSIIAPFKTDELGFDPSIHGEHERPTEHDARKHNRSLGPQYRSVPRAVLIHRIGDIWKRDRRRPK